MAYLPPVLGEPPHYSAKHRGPHIGTILTIIVIIAVLGFLTAVFVANVIG